MAASKLRRVRVEGSKNSVASFFRSQAWAYLSGFERMSWAVASRPSISSVVRSRMSMTLRFIYLLPPIQDSSEGLFRKAMSLSTSEGAM